MMIYYVYLYLREEDLTPYYVGKGKGKRAWDKKHHAIKVPTNQSRVVIVAHKLSEKEAFLLEKILINQFGRKNNGTGILRNLTDGGEGPSGFKHSVETKKKKSNITKMQHSSFTDDEKARRAINCSTGQKQRYLNSSDSTDTRRKKRESHQGTYVITSPDGITWNANHGLTEFFDSYSNELGITFSQLCWAYRKQRSGKIITQRRVDNNLWKVVRID